MAMMFERISMDLEFYEMKYKALVTHGFMDKRPELKAEMKKLIATLRTLRGMS